MKIFFRILKWLGLPILGLVVLLVLLLALDNNAEDIQMTAEQHAAIRPMRTLSSEVDSALYYQLLEEYGKNKKLAEDFEYQCLLALSHYPELKNTRIDFLVQPAFLPLASRPETMSVIFPWVKRKYLVIISNASADFFEKILLKNTPFNEQVGIIGHELAHTVYYQDKNSFQLAKIAYDYQYGDIQVAFERDTDKRAIAHGFGFQMYDFAYFVRRAFDDTEEEIESEEGDMYLSPPEILSEMQQYGFYDLEGLEKPPR
ncbi:MAG: hypothetical protein AAF242_03705 [Bacteroidota bacterium]